MDPGRLTLLTFGDHDRWSAAWPDGTPFTHHRLRSGVDVDESWVDICDVGATGALLIRPDQHVAWRGTDPPTADEFRAVIETITALVRLQS